MCYYLPLSFEDIPSIILLESTHADLEMGRCSISMSKMSTDFSLRSDLWNTSHLTLHNQSTLIKILWFVVVFPSLTEKMLIYFEADLVLS